MFKFKFERKPSYYLNKYRIVVIFAVLFLTAAFGVSKFLNVANITSWLQNSNLYALFALGMCMVMICGQIDLSMQMVSNLCACLTLGLYNYDKFPLIVAIIIGILAGGLFGLINGLLVSRANLNPFLVTLCTMQIAMGLVNLYASNGSVPIGDDLVLTSWMTKQLIPMFTPCTLITILLVVIFGIVMSKTRFGKAFFAVGSNRDAAWTAGIHVKNKLTQAFILSAMLGAVSNIVFAIGIGSAMLGLGTQGIGPQMIAIASVVIGGVPMIGGKGGVIRTYIAVLTITLIFNMLSNAGLDYSVQLLSAGIALTAVVLYESIFAYRQELSKGIRRPLLEEAELERKKNLPGSAARLSGGGNA